MPKKFHSVRENGIKFVFKMDEVDPNLLHIFARHLTSIEDSLDVYFDSEPTWNEEYQRFENYSDTHGLYWFWIDERDKVVMVVSCFKI
ncbi:hypothetical protein KA183_20830 [bacterium]|nr:hypothetical protein [bacterium]